MVHFDDSQRGSWVLYVVLIEHLLTLTLHSLLLPPMLIKIKLGITRGMCSGGRGMILITIPNVIFL